MIELLNDVFFMNAVQYIATIAAGAGGVWFVSQLTPSFVIQLQKTWLAFRQYEKRAITFVNDPTDAINVALGKAGIPPEVSAKVLPRLIEVLVDAIDEAAGNAG